MALHGLVVCRCTFWVQKTRAQVHNEFHPRNESRSKRGALIGRVAREELWVRFKNGAINAKDAEIVCNMTKNIRHEERIEEIQRRCCMLLEKGKGWDYIGAMCQLMANKESVFMKQGLLDFGADFEQDLDRAAKYVELNLSQLNAAIRRMKQGAKLGEKERAQAMRLGIDVSMSEGSEQLLQLLNDMKAKFEYIGSHPDLVASASMWDGKTDPDPVGQMIERAKREREAAESENEMTDEEWMEKKAREEAAAMTPSLFAMTPSLSFSVSPTLRDDIRRAAYNKMDAKEHVRLCTMPTVLRMLGEPYGDIYTLPGTISKLVYTHHLAHPEVYRAVEELEDPLFVFRDTEKSYLFVLEMQATNNKGEKSNVALAIQLQRSESGHYLLSAYPLDSLTKIKHLKNQGRLVYSKYTEQELEDSINKQATPPAADAPSPFKPDLMRAAVKDGLSEIVMTKQDIVKFNPPNFTASMTREQMDARYMAAVERAEIERVARENGTWLKAPNGEDSKLTPEQWTAVRTRAFKRWFGDWEKDPEHASRVVDENGEPLVVYHGTFDKFTRFKRTKLGNLYNPETTPARSFIGFWFSEERFSGYETYMECFLNIRNPELHYGLSDLDYEVNRDETTSKKKRMTYAKEYRDEITSYGRDGIIIEYDYESYGRSFIVLDPKQIKSATDNVGTYDAGNADITFNMNRYGNAERYMREAWAGDPRARLSGTSYNMERNLAAVHSLSPEKFLAAVELGGMPMPSVAITRLDRPYEWGGEGAINLIGKPEMVDPKKRSKVYMHDAYTGTMPPVKYKRKNAAAAERLKQDALDKLAAYGMGESDGLRRGIFSEDEEVVDGDAADWGYNRAMMAYWAITQAGYAPRPKMTEKPGQMSKDKHSTLKPWVAKLKKKDMKSEDFTADELEEFRGLMVAYYEGKKLRGAAKEYREMEAWRLARCAREEADKVRNYSTAKVPDGLENGKRFYEYAKKHAKAYSAWCKAEAQKYLGDKMFQRKYERRNWRGDVVDEWWGHEKYTLGNVLKYLRENKARGEEMSSITPGVFLAGVAEEMRNMREIGWARERVIGAEEYKKAKDEYEEAFSAFYDKACEIGREAGGGYFDLADAAMYNLLELVQGGKRMPARESVARALEQSGGKWTEESVDAAMHLLDKALGMPSDYMEAVPQRAVNMSEWEYAVLPKGLKKNKEVTDALKANGIQPIWHDGTEEGRREALASLVGDTAVSFSMERIDDVQDRWNNTLDEYLKNSNTTGSSEHTHDIVVCPTPAVMRMVGAKGLNMVLTPAVLSKVMHRKHSVTIDALRQLPSAMAAPICITESNKEGCIEVITELYEIVKGKNKNILVAVQLERNSSYSDGVKVNRIASLYGKNNIKALLGHRMLYMDAEKVMPWIKNYGIDEEKVRITSDSNGLQLSERVSDMRTYSDNIKGPDDLVKYKKQENTTFSMTRGAEDALEILRKRETEREGERLIREWQKQCELWSRLGGTDDAKIGKGSRIFGEMMALVSATKGVLPPEYTRMRGLGMSLQWAEIYADMANKGEVPMRGVMKGSIYDKFVSAIEKRREKDLLHGLTAEDAAENLKELAGRKLENIMQTVAETCRRHLESYLKGRERVRLEKVAGAAMPKEEPGKKTPRGKVSADIVRQVRRALELMDKAQNEIADEIDAAKEGLNRLDPDDPEYAAKEEMLQEQAYMAKTFGNWDGMTLEEARAAADAMAQIVSNGRAAWKEKLDRERRHIKYIIGRVSRNFRVPLEEYQGAGAMRDIAEKSRIPEWSSALVTPIISKNAAEEIKADFPELVNTDLGNNTLAMTRGAEDALTILRKRETEREGERLIREWQKQCELWSKLGGTDDAKIGRGSRIFGEMMAYWAITQAGYAPRPKMTEKPGQMSKDKHSALKP